MSLPNIDFAEIAKTAKEAVSLYGTKMQFILAGETVGREVSAVLYRDDKTEPLLMDADSSPANVLLNPDQFAAPNTLPRKFDQLRISVQGFVRTYTFTEDAHPILAENQLPLLTGKVRAN